MRWLIDGYNVMHAGGRLGPKLGREGFPPRPSAFSRRSGGRVGARKRRADHRGLRCVAAARRLPAPIDAIVESASSSLSAMRMPTPASSYLIADDSNPKTLTVVSTDRRIRQAAARRRARR